MLTIGGNPMPTYELVCRDCGAEFEVIASLAEYERMKSERTAKCTKCGSSNAAPQIATFDVHTTRKSA